MSEAEPLGRGVTVEGGRAEGTATGIDAAPTLRDDPLAGGAVGADATGIGASPPGWPRGAVVASGSLAAARGFVTWRPVL